MQLTDVELAILKVCFKSKYMLNGLLYLLSLQLNRQSNKHSDEF